MTDCVVQPGYGKAFGRKISCGDVVVYCDSKSAHLGDYMKANGRIGLFKSATNEGEFDRARFYRSQGIDFSVNADSIRTSAGKHAWYYHILEKLRDTLSASLLEVTDETTAGVLSSMLLGDKSYLDDEIKDLYRVSGISHILAISGVKTLKLGIPLVPETRINWAFVPLHIAIIYILKLCLGEEIIPRCRFPCSRGYLTKYINWQKKQSFSVSQSYCKSLINQQKEKKPMAYKKYREMKVYEASGYQYKRTPSIVLKGQWLSELGFDIGEQIEVKCEDGRLVITKTKEI